MANTYDTNVKLQAIATAITNAATSDPNLLAKLQAIADAITNGGGGGSVTASNVSVVPTSPFVSTNLQNLSVEEANAITANAGDITTINTALGNTSISGIGDGSVTGAIATNNSNINTINTALGNTSISGIGDGSVTGAISTLNSSNSTNTENINTLLSAIGSGKIKSASGSIAGCIENNSMYIIFASRVATNGCGVWLAHRFSGEIYTCEIQNTSNTYTLATNSVGTVAVSFTGGGTVWIGAVRVF